MKALCVLLFCLFSVLYYSACSTTKEIMYDRSRLYKPQSQILHDTIAEQDSIFFNAYNNCDLDKQAEYYSDNIEFFHDQGGLITSKQIILESTKANICGKVTRKLIKESLEVYPINGYGAVEIGFHQFENIANKEGQSDPTKFVIVWQQDNNQWKITKVISLH